MQDRRTKVAPRYRFQSGQMSTGRRVTVASITNRALGLLGRTKA